MTGREFIYSSLLFLLIILGPLMGIEFYIDYKVSQVKSGYVGKINKILEGETNESISIWGASTAETMINPILLHEKTNLTAFNYGLDGTNLMQFYGLLETYLENNKNKSVILSVDLHGALMRRKAVYRSYDWIHVINEHNIYNTLFEIDPDLAFKTKYFPGYKLLVYGKHNINYLKTKPRKNYHYPLNGFIPKDGFRKEKTENTPFQFLNDSMAIKKYEAIAQLANKNNNKVYLLLTPCFNDALQVATNYEETISLLCNIKGIEKTFNYSNLPLNKNRNFFRDNTHLNKAGADSLSKIFAQDFANYLFSLN